MQPSVDCPALRAAFSANPWLSHDDSSILALAAQLHFTRTQLINYWTRQRLRRLKNGEALFPEPDPGERVLKGRAAVQKQARARKARKEQQQRSYKLKQKRQKRASSVGVLQNGHRNVRYSEPVELVHGQVQDGESDNDSLTDIEELEEYLVFNGGEEGKSGLYGKHDEDDPDKTLIDDVSDSGMQSSPDEPLYKRVRFSLPEDGKAKLPISPTASPSTSKRRASFSNVKPELLTQQDSPQLQCSTSQPEIPKDAETSPEEDDIVDPDTEMLTLSDCEPLSMSDLDELLSSPPKKRSPIAGSSNKAQHATSSSKHSRLPRLKTFPAVVEYASSSAVQRSKITSIDQNLGRSAHSSTSTEHSRSFLSPEDERYWIDCALGLRKLDASDPPFSALSKEMQNYIREKCNLPKAIEKAVPPVAAEAVRAAEHSKTMQSKTNFKTEPIKPIHAFMPLALARHASKESIISMSSSYPTSPPRSTAVSTSSASAQSSSSRSTSANSSSVAASSSSSTAATTSILGSPIKLHCETPSRYLRYRPAASPETAPSYFWEFTSPSRPLVYDFDYTYELNGKEPSFGYMSTSATSTRESSVESMGLSMSDGEEKRWIMAFDNEKMPPAKCGMGPPIVVVDEDDDDDGYTWELDVSPSTKAHGLKLPNLHIIPPTPF